MICARLADGAGVCPPVTDDEQKFRQQQRWERAITCSVLAIIGSGLATLAASDAFFRARTCPSPRVACVSNLKSIEGAKATWALENKKLSNAVPTDAELFGATNYISQKPICPGGGRYTLGHLDAKPRCSIPGHTI